MEITKHAVTCTIDSHPYGLALLGAESRQPSKEPEGHRLQV